MADDVDSGGRGVSAGLVAAVVLALLLVIFVLQNTHEVRVELYFWDFEGPLWLVLAGSILVGLVALELATTVLRRGRRR